MDVSLDSRIVLELNKYWQAVKFRSVKEAITYLSIGVDGNVPGYVLDVIEENGKMVDAPRYTLDEWFALPVEPRHLPILTKRGAVRAPLVVISAHYTDLPVKAPSFSPAAIRHRDNYTCQVSGRYLGQNGGNMGHLKAKAKGGKKNWENIVLMDEELNRLQGTRTLKEMNWKLLKVPAAPKAVPVTISIKDAKHDSHRHFLVS